MVSIAAVVFRIDKTNLLLVLAVVVFVATQALWKRSRIMRAKAWPNVEAKIENVFIDTETSGVKYRREETYAALAYSYSVGESFYSGEIKLLADDSKVQELEKRLIGQLVTVHYNPRNPAQSVFVHESVRGWPVR